MLNYNSTDPEHIKARQNVVPPSVEEMEGLVKVLDYMHVMPSTCKILQRLIHDYELKTHFHDVVGGWGGFETAKNNSFINGIQTGKHANR